MTNRTTASLITFLIFMLIVCIVFLGADAIKVPDYKCADGFVKMHQLCVTGYDPALQVL